MSHVAVHVQKHLTPSNQNNQRLTLARTRYNAYCRICMNVPVCVVCYDFFNFMFSFVIYSVGINYYFSIQPFHQIENDGNNIRSRTIHSFCLALGIVGLNVICLAFNVEENISTLVTGHCKSHRRGVWEKIQRNDCRGFAFQCLQAQEYSAKF